jgi:hypothetical protein
VCEKSATVHPHSTPDGQSWQPASQAAQNQPKERTTAMNHFKLLLPKTLWLGTIGVATLLLGWAPSCKAQEVSPAHFTETAVEDAYPVEKAPAKKSAKVLIATRSIQAGPSSQAINRKQHARRVARRRNVVFAASN